MTLNDWMEKQLEIYNIKALYYFSYLENLESIIQNGILPKNQVLALGINFSSFANEDVQSRRDNRQICLNDNCSYNVHDVVPLYIVSKTPTLYSRKDQQERIFFCEVSPKIILQSNVRYAFSDGNLASLETRTYWSLKKLDAIDWNCLRSPMWTDIPDGRRKRNAEFVVHPSIPTNFIRRIVLYSRSRLSEAKEILCGANCNIKVEWDPRLFF